MPKDTGEFIISKSMNLRLPPILGYTVFLFIPRQVRFSQSLSHMRMLKVHFGSLKQIADYNLRFGILNSTFIRPVKTDL